MFFLRQLLGHLIKIGTLNVIDWADHRYTFSGEDGPEVTIRLHHRSLPRKLFFNPELRLGEAYMDGTLTVEEGSSLYDLLDLLGRNVERAGYHPVARAKDRIDRLFRRLQQYNPISKARAHAAHHYNISDELYEMFLDSDRQYSCAYFTDPGNSLERAQEDKKRHIAGKLVLNGGESILDVGCGWGGLGLFLAREDDARVTGITLSDEQLKVARRRAEKAGLADRVDFELQDYRELKGRFDRIVSVGMFEHVGAAYYREFFAKMNDLMDDDGVLLLHTIGRAEGPSSTSAWIRKYIFPGGYCPALSEIATAVEKVGLWITDVEVLRLHYAETLRHWRQRFLANRAKAAEIYDERFCRMWEFYLAGSEIAFRYLRLVVFQLQLAKRQDAVPLVRDYITDRDRGEPQSGKGQQAA